MGKMQIEYRENINYDKYENQKIISIDEEIIELIEVLKCCKNNNIDEEAEAIYKQIRKTVMREVKIVELAVHIVLRDIQEIRKKNNYRANIITAWVINNDMSYEDIGRMYNVSKQYIHGIIYWAGKKYRWINNLMQIKGEEKTRSSKTKVRKNSKRNEKRQEVKETLEQLVYHPTFL